MGARIQHDTLAILAAGPSAASCGIDRCRGRVHVLVLNLGYRRAPWADDLYGADADRFWIWYPDALEFAGGKHVARYQRSSPPGYPEKLERLKRAGVGVYRHTGFKGLAERPDEVRGINGLQHILSRVHHTHFRRVLLLGADMRGGHWHEPHPSDEPSYPKNVHYMRTLAAPLADQDVEVINCTPGSAIDFWPYRPLSAFVP